MKSRRRRHRSRAQRLRLKERVRRRFRIGRWRRIVVGLSVLVGVGLVVAAAGWGATYFFKSSETRVAEADAADEKPRTEPRLIGVWQSDPDATIAELRRTQALTDKDEKELRKRAFKTKVTYTDKMMATELDGVVETQKYTIVSQENDVVVLSTWFAVRMQDEEMRIRFVGTDIYWLEAQQFGETKSVTECFRRVR